MTFAFLVAEIFSVAKMGFLELSVAIILSNDCLSSTFLLTNCAVAKNAKRCDRGSLGLELTNVSFHDKIWRIPV